MNLLRSLHLLVPALIAALATGCSTPHSAPRLAFLPAVGPCYCSLRYEVKQRVGDLAIGNMILLVHNNGDMPCAVSLPDQEAQALLGKSAQTFLVTDQPAKGVSPGRSVAFVIPFAMHHDYLQAERLFALEVNRRFAVVGPAVDIADSEEPPAPAAAKPLRSSAPPKDR